MNDIKKKFHFTDSYLLQPSNPIKVNLIGAGGTGCKVLTSLMEINHSLIALGHAGLEVRLWDDDIITDSNLGRQRFAISEIGMYKSVCLVNRANRFSGTNWKAETKRFQRNLSNGLPEGARATIYISCVDNVKSRFEIANMLEEMAGANELSDIPKYWIDYGNSSHTGQVILSTIGNLNQPQSKKYQTISNLPFVTEEYKDLLLSADEQDDTPSCSLSDALHKQDLFINSTLAQMGSSLLWSLFRQGKIEYKGFFLNLANYQSQPIKIA